MAIHCCNLFQKLKNFGKSGHTVAVGDRVVRVKIDANPGTLIGGEREKMNRERERKDV